MLKTSRRFRALVALAAMAASMFAAQLALPGTAHAYCAGEDNPVLLELVINGTVYASEEASSGWCNGNGNGTYRGRFRSHVAGYKAFVYSNNGGNWTRFEGADDQSWMTWQIEDHDNAHTALTLCVQNKSTRWWTCGAGDDSRNSSPADGPNTTISVINEGSDSAAPAAPGPARGIPGRARLIRCWKTSSSSMSPSPLSSRR
ncbi:hypothetical protein [Allorhizocola rhizosphaerae]|uniref:hypothetical protein n=1 Tax=Allorhizocola rhizosphaerae TaxID=1872709 RepID=UPI000E3ED79D|nr:hypothetical protein [Allorhizocola rhizosphaerae]